MQIFIDLTGKTFGKWTVIKQTASNAHGDNHWLCKCECGLEKPVRGADLKGGKSKSCISCAAKKDTGDAAFNVLCGIYKRNAKKAGREFTLSDDNIRKLISSNCYYCKTPPSQIIENKFGNGNLIYTGIDRINNSKGYTIDNVRSCCDICNFMKHTAHEDEFLSMVKAIYKHMNLQSYDGSEISE